jgi:MFS family permease
MGATMSVGLLILYPIFLRFFSIKTVMRFSLLFVLIGLISCSLLSSLTAQWLFSNIVAIFTGCAYVSLVALIADKTDDQHRGLVMGYLSTALYLAWMLTAFNGGFLISWHAKLPLILAAIFLFIGVVTTAINRKHNTDVTEARV